MTIKGQDQAGSVRNAMSSAMSTAVDKRDNQNQNRDTERDPRDTRDAPRGEDVRAERRHDDRPESKRNYSQVRTASMSQISRLNPMPLSMTGTGEVLESFRSDLVAAMPTKEDTNMLSCTVHAIDANSAGIPFSLVVVAGTRAGKEGVGVGYHTFILAGSAETLRPREESYRGNRIQIVQVPGDGYDSRTRETIREVLQAYYVGKTLLTADAEVIQPGFPRLKDDADAIAECVKNAFAAIKQAISRHDNDAIRLTVKDDGESYNTIHVQHRQNHIYDRGHNPMRADVIIDLHSREGRGRNSRDSIDQLVGGKAITRVGGYWDFVYAPTENARAKNDLIARRPNARMEGDEYQFYIPRFITTFMETADFSEEAIILGQATVKAVSDEREFMRSFEPNMTVGEDDMRNIGALAIEPNLQELERGFGERAITKTDFPTAKRYSLLQATLRPGTIQSIDVPECGASTWQYISLMAAAKGNKKAMDRLYDAACVLTDGAMEDYYRRGDPIFDEHIERVHEGYYIEGGQRLDLRDLGYLELMNLLRPEKVEDLEVIQKWSMAAYSGDESPMTQSERYEIITQFITGAVVTGFHLRLNWDVRWNEAVAKAIEANKVSLNPTSTGRDSGDRYRTTYGNIDNILNRPGSGGLYRHRRAQQGQYDDRNYDRSDRNFEGRFTL